MRRRVAILVGLLAALLVTGLFAFALGLRLYYPSWLVERWLEGILDPGKRTQTAAVLRRALNAWIPDYQDFAFTAQTLTRLMPEGALHRPVFSCMLL